MRVGLTPTPRSAGASRAGASRRRRTAPPRRSRPAPSSCSGSRRSAGQISTRARRVSTRAPAARSIRSVWSRVCTGSSTVVGPSPRTGRQAGARLDLRARHGQLVFDRAAGPRLDPRAAGGPSVVSTPAPICASGSRCAPSAASAATRRPSARSFPPGRRASRGAAARACRRCHSRSPRGRRPRRPAPATRTASPPSPTSTPSARTAAIVDSVSAGAAEALDHGSHRRRPRRAGRAVRDRLVAGTRDAALHGRSRLDLHSARTGATDTP